MNFSYHRGVFLIDAADPDNVLGAPELIKHA